MGQIPQLVEDYRECYDHFIPGSGIGGSNPSCSTKRLTMTTKGKWILVTVTLVMLAFVITALVILGRDL